MNKVVLVGRLTKDPEMKVTQDGKTVTRYTLAVDRYNKDPDFIHCVAFGKTAEVAGKYFTKGLRVAVSGNIKTGSYTNRDGQKVYTTDVQIESQEFAQSKSEETPKSEPKQVDMSEWQKTEEEDLPFF